jgi:hypothetical protein
MPKILDPFKLSSAVRPQYWARRQRWASTELVISTVCTMTSSGQAAHSISQTLTKTLAFHSSILPFLLEAVCLVYFGFVADEKAFGSCQCRLMILFSTGGGADATVGTTGSVGCNAEVAGTS